MLIFRARLVRLAGNWAKIAAQTAKCLDQAVKKKIRAEAKSFMRPRLSQRVSPAGPSLGDSNDFLVGDQLWRYRPEGFRRGLLNCPVVVLPQDGRASAVAERKHKSVDVAMLG
jgi:hypothetical protein